MRARPKGTALGVRVTEGYVVFAVPRSLRGATVRFRLSGRYTMTLKGKETTVQTRVRAVRERVTVSFPR